MGNGKNKEKSIEVLILILIFALYIVAAIGNDREGYRRDRERRGIRDDD